MVTRCIIAVIFILFSQMRRSNLELFTRMMWVKVILMPGSRPVNNPWVANNLRSNLGSIHIGLQTVDYPESRITHNLRWNPRSNPEITFFSVHKLWVINNLGLHFNPTLR